MSSSSGDVSAWKCYTGVGLKVQCLPLGREGRGEFSDIFSPPAPLSRHPNPPNQQTLQPPPSSVTVH